MSVFLFFWCPSLVSLLVWFRCETPPRPSKPVDCVGGKSTFCKALWKIACLPVISAQVFNSVFTDCLIRLLCVLSPRPSHLSRCSRRNTLKLQPAFDTLHRNANLHEDILAGFRVSGISDGELFVTVDANLVDFNSTCRDAIGVDPSSGGVEEKNPV